MSWWLLALILVGVVVPIAILNRGSFNQHQQRDGFAQAATATGETSDPQGIVVDLSDTPVFPASAAGFASAFDVQLALDTSVAVELAQGSGDAAGASVAPQAIVQPEVALGSGAVAPAHVDVVDNSGDRIAQPEVASGAGMAVGPIIEGSGNAVPAEGSGAGAAFGASVTTAVFRQAPVAMGSGQGIGAIVRTSVKAQAPRALGTGSAFPVTKKPSAPADPVLSGTAGDSVNNLVWSTPFNNGATITSYGVLRDLQGLAVLTGNPPPNQYPDTTAINGVNYTYLVVATNSQGSGNPSNPVALKPSGSAFPGDVVNGQAANKIIMWTGNQDPIQYGAAVRQAWKNRGAGGFTVGNPYFVGFGGGSSWTAVPAPNTAPYTTQRELESASYGNVAMMHAEGLEVGLALKMHSGNTDTIPQSFAWSDRVNPPGDPHANPPTGPPDYSTKNVLFDSVMRADLCDRFRDWATAARTLGCDFVTFDWEGNDGHGNLNPPGLAKPFDDGYSSPDDGHTLAAAVAAAYQLGVEIGNALKAGWPGYKFVNYSLYPPGGWNEEIQFVVNSKGFWQRYPAATSPYNGRPSWHILRGMLDAGGYTWCEFFDHSFYKSTQIGNASWATALKWNNEGCAASLSQYLSPAGWQYAAPRCFMKPFVWIDEHVGDADKALGNITGEGLYARDRGAPTVAAELAALRAGGASALTGHTSIFMFARPGIVGVGGGNPAQAYMVRADGMGYTQGGDSAPSTFIYDGYAYTGDRSSGPLPTGAGVSGTGSHLPGILAASQPGTVDSTPVAISNITAPTRAGNTVTWTGIRISHPKGAHHLEAWVSTTPNTKFYATMTWDKGGGAYNTGIPNTALVCAVSVPNAAPGATVILAAVSAQGQKKHVSVVV